MRREASRLTRERFAVAAGISVATLVRLENLGAAPKLDILERIAAQLDTTAAALLYEAATDEPHTAAS
jgi:transcriptional regulator with XRE-family HTH domain